MTAFPALPAMIRQGFLRPIPPIVDLVGGAVVEGDPMLGDSPGAEVEGDDEEPGDDDELQQEGKEREEQAGDGLTNCFGPLNNRESRPFVVPRVIAKC